MGHRIILRTLALACAAAGLVLIPAATAVADPNAGDVWVDNVLQPAGPGHENDPHLACRDINLWGNGLADSSGTYTVDGWPPSGSQEQDYGPSQWHYDQSMGGTQVLDVIYVKTLIANAIANGDTPQANQGFHFKLQFSSDPQKHKTFWVNCASPALSTSASAASAGGSVHDVATLSGGNSPTGTISWNVYNVGAGNCTAPLNHSALTVSVNGDGAYSSPAFTPSAPGSYQWVATYSGDGQNLGVASSCHDPSEVSTVSPASPAISTSASSAAAGGSVHDVATLSGGDSPTGTISWNVYNASDTSCVAPLNQSPLTVSVNGDGTYTSPDFAPGTGSYQWVANYSGDANNSSVASNCNDPHERSTIPPPPPPPAPGISLIKLERDGTAGSFTHGPITGSAGDSISYQMTVVNTGNTPLLITFSDPRCDAGTLSAPTVISGTFSAGTLSAGGELEYTCSHVLAASDAPQFTNTASVTGQPPSGSPVSATDSVVALVNVPGMQVLKLQRDGTSGPFNTGTITAKVGDPIEYEIQVTNTGNTPLTLSLSDPQCDPGTVQGPTALSGTLSMNVLSAGGEAQYTCSHVLTSGDASPFTNTATVTGQPPTGPALVGISSVTANKAAVLPIKIASVLPTKILRCGPGKVKKTKKVHGKTVAYCVAKKRAVISRRPVRPSGFTG